MRKIGNVVTLLLLIGCFVFFMVSCQTENPTPEPEEPKKYLNSIQLDTANVKKEYYLGEEFTSANLVVKANYSDGTTEDVSSSAEVDSSYYDKGAIGAYPVYVTYTYEGRVKSLEFEVKVKTLLTELQQKYLVGLDVTKEVKEYKVNTPIDVTDLTVSAVYSDDSRTVLTEDKYKTNADKIDITSPTVKPLVVEYSEKYQYNSLEQTIVAKNFVYITHLDPLKSIKFVSGKTEFEFASSFDTSDWKIEATYESGATKEVTDYTVTPINTMKSGKQRTVLTYKENGVTKVLRIDVVVGENPNGDYEINKVINASSLKVTDVEINPSRKQAMDPSEIDSFFTVEGKIIKYLTSDNKSVSSLEMNEGNQAKLKFTIEGIVKMSLSASSNGGSNCSLLKVSSSDGVLQKQTTALPETSTGLISIKGSGALTIDFVLQPGTYIIEFVSGTDDSSNAGGTITATRAGRIWNLSITTN